MYCICGAAAIVCGKMMFGLDNTFDKTTIFYHKNKKDMQSLFGEQIVKDDCFVDFFSKVATACKQILAMIISNNSCTIIMSMVSIFF